MRWKYVRSYLVVGLLLGFPAWGQKGKNEPVLVDCLPDGSGGCQAVVSFGVDTLEITAAGGACTLAVTRNLDAPKKLEVDGVIDLADPQLGEITVKPVLCTGIRKAISYDIVQDGGCAAPYSVQIGCPTSEVNFNPRIVRCDDFGCDADVIGYWPFTSGPQSDLAADPIRRPGDSFSKWYWASVVPTTPRIPAVWAEEPFLSPLAEGKCQNAGATTPVKVQVCEPGTGVDGVPCQGVYRPDAQLLFSTAQVEPCFQEFFFAIPGQSSEDPPFLDAQDDPSCVASNSCTGVYAINWTVPAEPPGQCVEGGDVWYTVTVTPGGFDLPAITAFVCVK
jgi:hypothetical protein